VPERWDTVPDEEREQIDFDPRWEIQPETDDADDQRGDPRRTLITLVVIGAAVGLLGWLMLGSAPPF
jgi:hypothetical protein